MGHHPPELAASCGVLCAVDFDHKATKIRVYRIDGKKASMAFLRLVTACGKDVALSSKLSYSGGRNPDSRRNLLLIRVLQCVMICRLASL